MNLDEALCTQTYAEAFFDSTSIRQAKAVCARCALVSECLDEGLSIPVDDDYGVWGGTTKIERLRIRAEPQLRERHLQQLVKKYPINQKEVPFMKEIA